MFFFSLASPQRVSSVFKTVSLVLFLLHTRRKKNVTLHCGWKSISFVRPIKVSVSYNMLAQYSSFLYSRCSNLVVSFLPQRNGWLNVGKVCIIPTNTTVPLAYVRFVCNYGLSAICSIYSFHCRFILNVICPRIIYSNVLHSKYFSP